MALGTLAFEVARRPVFPMAGQAIHGAFVIESRVGERSRPVAERTIALKMPCRAPGLVALDAAFHPLVVKHRPNPVSGCVTGRAIAGKMICGPAALMAAAARVHGKMLESGVCPTINTMAKRTISREMGLRPVLLMAAAAVRAIYCRVIKFDGLPTFNFMTGRALGLEVVLGRPAGMTRGAIQRGSLRMGKHPRIPNSLGMAEGTFPRKMGIRTLIAMTTAAIAGYKSVRFLKMAVFTRGLLVPGLQREFCMQSKLIPICGCSSFQQFQRYIRILRPGRDIAHPRFQPL